MKKLFVLLLLALLILMQTITGFSFDTLTGQVQEAVTKQEDDFLKRIDWHGEYDVIVVGYGGAGAAASIAAADEGAKVLLIEKAPKGEEGGNTRFAMQAVISIDKENTDKGVEYFKNLRGKFNTPSDEMIKTYLNYASQNYEWLKYLGADNISVFPFREYDLPGGEVMEALLSARPFNIIELNSLHVYPHFLQHSSFMSGSLSNTFSSIKSTNFSISVKEFITGKPSYSLKLLDICPDMAKVVSSSFSKIPSTSWAVTILGAHVSLTPSKITKS
jgi:hypothetical protein